MAYTTPIYTAIAKRDKNGRVMYFQSREDKPALIRITFIEYESLSKHISVHNRKYSDHNGRPELISFDYRFTFED